MPESSQWSPSAGPVPLVEPGHEEVREPFPVRSIERMEEALVSCRAGFQQYCDNNDITFTYNAPDKKQPGAMTYGGYSSRIVVDERFCLHLPGKLDLAAAAPLLCAGITTYSPLKHWGAGKGAKIGIVGLGGLGHMGVKLSHAFGAHTVLFTTSPGKTITETPRLLTACCIALCSTRGAWCGFKINSQ